MPGCRPVFLCTQKDIDRVILEAAQLPFVPQPIVPPVRTVGGLLKFWKSWRDTKDLVVACTPRRNTAPDGQSGVRRQASGGALDGRSRTAACLACSTARRARGSLHSPGEAKQIRSGSAATPMPKGLRASKRTARSERMATNRFLDGMGS
jgi:hypothetical protein